ncbi:MAG: alpha/beta fold hydrolase [Xenococcaceae cyanobacterium]
MVAQPILLVHGAAHTGQCWQLLEPELKSRGFEPYALTLPGHTPNTGNGWRITMKRYSQALCEAARVLGGSIPVVGHSMGGMVMTQATETEPSLFSKLIYLTALLPPKKEVKESRNIVSMMKGASKEQDLPGSGIPKFYLLAGTAMIEKTRAMAQFYSAVEPELQSQFINNLTPQPIRPMWAGVTWTAEKTGKVPRAYIECTEDRAVSIERQREWQRNGEIQEIYTLKCGHSAFAEIPGELAECILTSVDLS